MAGAASRLLPPFGERGILGPNSADSLTRCPVGTRQTRCLHLRSSQHLWQDTTGLCLCFLNLQPLNHRKTHSIPNTPTLQRNCFMLRPVSGQITPKCPSPAPAGETAADNILVGKVPVYTPKCTSWICCGSALNGISTGDKHESIFCSHRYQQEHGLL